jgi:hypothetical protein
MRRKSPAPVVAAAFLSAAADRSLFTERWRLLDLKHETRGLNLRLLSAKRTDGQMFTDEARALAEYVHLTQLSAGVGFVAALEGETWETLDRQQRAQMRSAQEFCVERLLRQVCDRLDAQGASAALTLVLPFDRRTWMAHAVLLDASLARDSRTDRLLASVNFATAAFDRRLDAARILQASMRAELQRKPSTSGHAPHALTAWAVQSTISEIWDAEACKRRLHKLAWDAPE